LREFHQFGIECLNSPFPESDVEVICLATSFINELGIKNCKLNLNSIGNQQSRTNYKKILTDFLNSHRENLSEESRNRLENNPLRVLDSKNPIDIEIVKNAPNILDSLDEESLEHFDTVKNLLAILQINYEINPILVRGLDYYSHTVFEFQSNYLGSQDAFGGGGRYNSLFSELGGKDTPAVGFAMGIERLLLILEQIGEISDENKSEVMVISTNEKHLSYAMKICDIVRNEFGKSCLMDLSRRSMKSQLREANKSGVKYAIIIGDDEVANNSLTVKYMQENKEQCVIPIDAFGSIF
jgi:histidyl-tRNA synthetase